MRNMIVGALVVALMAGCVSRPSPPSLDGLHVVTAAAAERCAMEGRWACAADGYELLSKSAPTATERRAYRIKAERARKMIGATR